MVLKSKQLLVPQVTPMATKYNHFKPLFYFCRRLCSSISWFTFALLFQAFCLILSEYEYAFILYFAILHSLIVIFPIYCLKVWHCNSLPVNSVVEKWSNGFTLLNTFTLSIMLTTEVVWFLSHIAVEHLSMLIVLQFVKIY